jgi:peptide/nickel transport system substrate-binding protein
MTPLLRVLASGGLLLTGMGLVNDTQAQKAAGVWKISSPDSPASMSPFEETTVYAVGPMMGVFNNLILFDQHVKQNSLQSIVPDLATSWSWSEDRPERVNSCELAEARSNTSD